MTSEYTLHDYAKFYHAKKWSVIPVRQDKKPFVKWEPYQSNRANLQQIEEWWQRWPDANIGIVTGPVSKIMVVDVDSQKGLDALGEFLPDTLSTPIATTPGGGWHYYFDYKDGLVNRARVITDCDIRTVGGYIVAPPSVNGNGKAYAWLDGFKINQIKKPRAMPDSLFDVLLQFNAHNAYTRKENKIYTNTLESSVLDRGVTNRNKAQQSATSKSSAIFTKGRRDNDLFHVANALTKGGCSEDVLNHVVNIIANNCTPPFPPEEIRIKIQSALNREESRTRNLTQDVRDWVAQHDRNINVTQAYQDVTKCNIEVERQKERAKIRTIFGRLVKEGTLERVGDRAGWFRKIETDAPDIDIYAPTSGLMDIRYPLDMQDFFLTMEKNIIVFAGAPDAGKTALALETTRLNANRGLPIRYMSSEMGPQELVSRLEKYQPDVPMSFWKNINFKEVAANWQDYILPDGINIIDYLETPTGEYFKIEGILRGVFDKLRKGIAIVCLQKKFGQDMAYGAETTMKLPRLYLSIEPNPPEGNVGTIIKCKNRANSHFNPYYATCVFKIVDGCRVIKRGNWFQKQGKKL